MPTSTQLFVYGTLRHDQPEHGFYCRGVTGWRRARMQGRLFRLREGYLIVVVRPEAILMEASCDPVADEARAARLVQPAPLESPGLWVEGEVLEFSDAAVAWPPLDAWECYQPGGGSAYRRCVMEIERLNDSEVWEKRLAWAYVTGSAPAGAVAE